MVYEAFQKGRLVGTFTESDYKRISKLPAYRGVTWKKAAPAEKPAAKADKLPKGVEPAQKGQPTKPDNEGDIEPSPANRAGTGGAGRKAEK